jgi:uncharacterized protein (UPF0335 family)
MNEGMHDAVRRLEEEKRAQQQQSTTTKPDDLPPAPKGSNTKELRSLVDRIVRLEEEKRGLQDDIKTIYASVKDAGFNPKSIRVIVKREMETADQCAARKAVEAEVDNITVALGDFASSPLGGAAVSRATHR